MGLAPQGPVKEHNFPVYSNDSLQDSKVNVTQCKQANDIDNYYGKVCVESNEYDITVPYNCGGGVLLNENVQIYNQLYKEACNNNVPPSEASRTEGDWCTNIEGIHDCLVNRMFMKVYNNDGECCHILSAGNMGEHSSNTSDPGKHDYLWKVGISIVESTVLYANTKVNMVYIHDDNDGSIRGYYYLLANQDSHYDLMCCAYPPEGHLKVVSTLFGYVIEQGYDKGGYQSLMLDPKLAYHNYCKDLQSWQLNGCSYEAHIVHIIDKMITEMDQYMADKATVDTMDAFVIQDDLGRSTDHDIKVPNKCASKNDTVGDGYTNARPHRDFNYPNKKVGYLSQASTEFEFIGPDKEPVLIDSVDKLISIANSIRDSGLPNYRGVRIPIKSGLNIEAWEKYLQDYADRSVLQYIKFGFPLSLVDPGKLNNSEVTNHYSARQYPSQVQDYIDKEIELGALLGPIKDMNHEHFHCSPLLTRPKGPDKRRVILDLSYPHECSVNSQVDKNRFDGSPFILKFSTVDDIALDIVECTQDPVLLKVDIARAFRNLRVDPVDSLKLGIKWQDAFFIDVGIAFGWTHGSASFQILSDAVAHIMSKEGVKLRCYIDDYIAVVPRSEADNIFHRLCTLLNELGLPINHDKLTPPTKGLECLGIYIDIDNNTMSISEEKLGAIYTECLDVSTKSIISKKKYQSLLGKLLYIQKCVKPARIFIDRILALFRANSHLARIQLSEEFHRDVQWFLKFLPAYNGISYIHKYDIDDEQSLYLDACLTGMGAIWRDRVYATPIHNCGGLNLKIIHLEMLNIVIALRAWGRRWRHSAISIFCDNLGVIQVVETGRTRDPFLALCIRNIWLITATWDIQLNIQHIPGVYNVIADTLSRVYSDKPVNLSLLNTLQSHCTWENIPPSYFNLDLLL